MSLCFIPKKKTIPLPNPGYQKDHIAKGFTQIESIIPMVFSNGPSWMCLKYLRPKMHWVFNGLKRFLLLFGMTSCLISSWPFFLHHVASKMFHTEWLLSQFLLSTAVAPQFQNKPTMQRCGGFEVDMFVYFSVDFLSFICWATCSPHTCTSAIGQCSTPNRLLICCSGRRIEWNISSNRPMCRYVQVEKRKFPAACSSNDHRLHNQNQFLTKAITSGKWGLPRSRSIRSPAEFLVICWMKFRLVSTFPRS